MAEIILGIDHGNGNMKGSNVDFPCGLVRYTSEPGRFMNEDILEYQGTFYTLSETRMPFKADKTVDEDYFILTLFALALEAKSRGITLTGKDIVLGVGLPPADFSQQAPGFKKYFMEHAKHGISFKFNGKSVSCYLKDTFVSPQNFAAVMCYKASLFKQYRTVNCIDIGDVPLFFICSGYLYQKYSKVNSIGSWCKNVAKKALALGVPYATFTTATWVLKKMFSSSVNDQIGGLGDTLLLHPTAPYWYLYALFFIFLVTPTFSSVKAAAVGLVVAIVAKGLILTGGGQRLRSINSSLKRNLVCARYEYLCV